MSDESFFREVNEELRQDRARQVWDRYGIAAICVAAVILVATGIYVGWQYWSGERANRSGDAFSQALLLSQADRTDEALASLEELQADGYGAYPTLARMRAATIRAQAGDPTAAIADFDAVANDGSLVQIVRDAARIRAGYLLIDHGTYDDVAARVQPLTSDDSAMRHSAREALGLAAWKDGRNDEALRLFDIILEDQGAPSNLRQRADLMAGLIRGSQEAS